MAGTANNNAKKNIRQKVVNRFIDEPPFDEISGSLFVGWVESAGGLGFSVFGGPTYLRAIFMLSAKPNKMAEDRTIPEISNHKSQLNQNV
jgi:hypothetical protein